MKMCVVAAIGSCICVKKARKRYLGTFHFRPMHDNSMICSRSEMRFNMIYFEANSIGISFFERHKQSLQLFLIIFEWNI